MCVVFPSVVFLSASAAAAAADVFRADSADVEESAPVEPPGVKRAGETADVEESASVE